MNAAQQDPIAEDQLKLIGRKAEVEANQPLLHLIENAVTVAEICVTLKRSG